MPDFDRFRDTMRGDFFETFVSIWGLESNPGSCRQKILAWLASKLRKMTVDSLIYDGYRFFLFNDNLMTKV